MTKQNMSPIRSTRQIRTHPFDRQLPGYISTVLITLQNISRTIFVFDNNNDVLYCSRLPLCSGCFKFSLFSNQSSCLDCVRVSLCCRCCETNSSLVALFWLHFRDKVVQFPLNKNQWKCRVVSLPLVYSAGWL